MTTKEYRALDAVNQSRLKLLLQHPSRYLSSQDDGETRDHFLFGQFVEDALIQSDEYLDNKYYVTKAEAPTDSILKVLKLLSQQSSIDYIDEIDADIVLQACRVCGYGKSWKDETCIAKIHELGSDYYSEMKKSEGKIRLGQANYNLGMKLATEALSSPSISPLFNQKAAKENNCEILFKKILEFNYRIWPCKGEIDLFYIDHGKKTARVFDIKTSAQAMFFQSTILKYRYDFQVYFYSLGAIASQLVPPDYTILPPKFIVLDTRGELPTTVWDCPAHIDNRIPADFEYNGRMYEGIDSAFTRLHFHQSMDMWDYPMEYYNSGSMPWT